MTQVLGVVVGAVLGFALKWWGDRANRKAQEEREDRTRFAARRLEVAVDFASAISRLGSIAYERAIAVEVGATHGEKWADVGADLERYKAQFEGVPGFAHQVEQTTAVKDYHLAQIAAAQTQVRDRDAEMLLTKDAIARHFYVILLLYPDENVKGAAGQAMKLAEQGEYNDNSELFNFLDVVSPWIEKERKGLSTM